MREWARADDDRMRAVDPRLSPGVLRVATGLFDELEEISAHLLEQVLQQEPTYDAGRFVSRAELRRAARADVEHGLRIFVGHHDPPDVPEQIGRCRAEQGVPLRALLRVYRLCGRYLWERLVRRSLDSGAVGPEELIGATAYFWEIVDQMTETAVSAYQEAQSELLLRSEQQRSVLVEALLEGNVAEAGTLWDVAELLRLPYRGVYVVVAAEVDDPSSEALVGVESKLAALGFSSAWRLRPELQVGVVHLRRAELLDRLLTCLRELAVHRVGVSAPYERLEQTPMALRHARVALTGLGPNEAEVAVFDNAPLGVVAVSAPDVTERVAYDVLGPVLDLAPEERSVLIEALATWIDSNGSTSRTAQLLYCHPNTVRHRLRRVERKTGRRLTDPRAMAELVFALETVHRLARSTD